MNQPSSHSGPAFGASAQQTPISSRRRVLALFITVIGTMVVGVVALEIIFRLFVPVVDVPFVFWDPVVGTRRAPDQQGRLLKGRYIDAHYRFNNQGWNSEHDYAIEKPKGRKRICLVGDSQVESYQVDIDKTFFSLAERIMNRPDRPLEWYAFGCSGFGPSQESAVIRHYALDYHPDLVLLLFVENDPFDSSPYVFPVENWQTSYYLDANDQLVLLSPHFWQPRGYRRFAASSALVRYFTVQKDVFHKQDSQAHVLGGIYLREGTSNKAIHVVPGLEKLTIDQRKSLTWKVIEKIMETTRDECIRRGSRFAIVYRGSTPILAAALEGKTYTPLPREKDPYCLSERLFEMGDEYLAPMAKRLNIPYFDLTATIRQLVVETKKPHVFVDDGHWNDPTHAAAAKALANWSEKLLAGNDN